MILTASLLALLFAPPAPEAEIRAVLDKQQADWNRGDVVAFMSGYEESPAITFQGKALARGFAAVLERYKKNYPDRARMGTLTFSGIEVRLLGGDAALVLGAFALERTPEGGGPASGRFRKRDSQQCPDIETDWPAVGEPGHC